MFTSSASYKTAISTVEGVVRQARITGTITLPDNSIINVTDDDILADSLYIDEMIVPGEDLAIGGAIASEMGLKLINPTINPSVLDGAEIDLDYGIVTGYVGAVPTWEDIPLGIYNVAESKRTGIYVDIKALDNLRRADSTMWVTTVPSTCEDNIIAAAQTVSYKPTGSVANSVSSSDKLQITVNHQLEGAVKLFYYEYLYQNTTDNLSVVIQNVNFSKYTQVRIKIYLANATPAKNSAALIQTAIRALAGTYPTYSLDTVICNALGDWDTTTTAPSATYIATLMTQYAVSTTGAEFDSYPNYLLLTNYSNYVSSRDMIIWMCQINSTFARMSRTDQLEVLPLHKSTVDRIITKAERYKTYVSDSTVKVTAIQMTINGVVHVVGTTGLTMELPENPFMTGLSSAAIDTALTNILNDITLAEYKPFELEFIGDPTLQPGDWITLEYAPPSTGETVTLQNVYNDGVMDVTVEGNSEQTATVQGKNLFDKTRATQGHILTSALDPTIVANASYGVTDYIRINPSTVYCKSGNTGGQVNYYYTADKTPISGFNAVTGVFTTPANAYYIRMNFILTSINTLQLELGSTATDYEAFVPNSPSPDYPSAINSVSGDITSHNSDSSLTDSSALPTLRKIGAVADTYHLNDGAMVQNIGVKAFDGSETFTEPTDAPMVTNLITNGDFSNGTTGWTELNSVISSNNNTMTITGNGTFNVPRAKNTTTTDATSGHKVYIRSSIKVTNSSCTTAAIQVKGASGSILLHNYRTNPTLNTIYTVGEVLTLTDQVGYLVIEPRHYYADIATANGKAMEVKNVLVIDLTAAFGAGNEPTAAQMDAWLTRFNNSWFDGSKSYLAFPYCYKYTLTGAKAGANSLCTHFKNTVDAHLYASGLNGDYEQDGETFYFNAADYPTVTLFKAWLAAQDTAGTPVTIDYELDTPVVTTDTVKVLGCYTPTTIINSDSTVLPTITAFINGLPELITHSTWHFRGHQILRGVGRTTATIKPVSQLEKSVNALKIKTSAMISAVSPDDFNGTDYEKLVAAFASAITNESAIRFERIYDITGYSISIDKPITNRRILHLIGDSGGIRKDDAGYIFTAPHYIYDIISSNMKYYSTDGEGTIAWDGNTIIRFTSHNDNYENVDTINEAASSYSQSVRFIGCTIVGGSGWAFDWLKTYDTTIKDCTIEHRENGIRNTAFASNPDNDNLRIIDNVIEGLSGIAIQLGSTFACMLSGNYMEANAGGYIDLAQSANYHNGLMISGNSCQQTAGQIAADTPFIDLKGVGSNSVFSSGNVATGVLYKLYPDGTGGRLVSVSDISYSGEKAINYPSQLSDFGKLINPTATSLQYGRTTVYTASSAAVAFASGEVKTLVISCAGILTLGGYEIINVAPSGSGSSLMSILNISIDTAGNNVNVLTQNLSASSQNITDIASIMQLG